MFSVENLIRCAGFSRRLGRHLFVYDPEKCNACIKKDGKANVFFPRSQRSRRSVNNTFISREILAGNDAIDPIVYYRSIVYDRINNIVAGQDFTGDKRVVDRSPASLTTGKKDILLNGLLYSYGALLRVS